VVKAGELGGGRLLLLHPATHLIRELNSRVITLLVNYQENLLLPIE
jgi:hypothetical protein